MGISEKMIVSKSPTFSIRATKWRLDEQKDDHRYGIKLV